MFLAGEGRLRKGNRPAKIFVDLRRQSGGIFASGEVVPIRELSAGQWEPRGKPIRFYVSGNDDTMARSRVEEELDHHLSEFTLRKSRKNPAIDPDLLSQEKNSKAIMEAYESGVRNFRMGDFSGMFLAGMDFSGSNLELANFTGADLQGADFQNCNLESAVFSGANLANAAFSKSNLENANLENVDGTSAYFEETNLVNASFRGSDLRGATFKDATFDKTDFRGADLRDAYLETPYIGTVDFRDAKIQKWPQIYAEAILTGEQTRNPGPKAHHKTGIKMMKDARKCWDRYCKHQDIADALDCFEMLSVAHQELSYAKDKDNLKEVKQGLREVTTELSCRLKAHEKDSLCSEVTASLAAQVDQAIERNPLKRGQRNPISASEIKKIRRSKLRRAMKSHGVRSKDFSKIKKASTRSKIRKATKNPGRKPTMTELRKKMPAGWVIKKEDDEYAVYPRGEREPRAYYTNDWQDAINTAHAEARRDKMFAAKNPKRKTAVAKRNPDDGYNGWEVDKYMSGPPHQWTAKIREPNGFGVNLLRTVNECNYELNVHTVDGQSGSYIMLELTSGCDPDFYEHATISTRKFGLVLEAPKFQSEELLKEATSWANKNLPKKKNPSKRSGSETKTKKKPARSKKKVSKARRNPGKVYGHQFKVNQIFPDPSVDIVDREAFVASDHGLDEAEVTELMRMREDSSMVVGGLAGGPMYSVYRGKGRDPSLPYEERLQPISGEFEANPRHRRRNPGAFLRTVEKQISRLSNGRLVLKRDELRDHLASMKDPQKELGPTGYDMATETLKLYEAEIEARGLKTNPKKKDNKKSTAAKAKAGARRVGKKAKKAARTDVGRAAIGAGAGALLLGPIGAVAGAGAAMAAKHRKNPAPKGKLTQKQASDFVKKEKIRLGKLPKKYYPMWVETYEAAKAYYGDAQTGGRVAWAQVKKYCEKKGEKWVCGPLPKAKANKKKTAKRRKKA